jgi:hypothetical protein
MQYRNECARNYRVIRHANGSLEQYPTGLNRGGFPNRRIFDSFIPPREGGGGDGAFR